MQNQKSRFLSGFVFGLLLTVGLMSGLNLALATWSEPTLPPPGGNINPFVKTLSDVLADGSSASGFLGNVNIGDSGHAANFYLSGGEIRSKWLHASGAGDNTISGNLAVGKATAPSAVLDVNGEARAVKIYTTGAAETNVLSGKVAINKSSVSSGASLDVNGEVWGTAFIYASDRRLKQNIRNIESPLTKILALRGVVFEWLADGRTDTGLIAQDVETVFPEAVKTDESTGLKAVEYGNLIAPLIEAIREQQQQIDFLRSKIEKLEE